MYGTEKMNEQIKIIKKNEAGKAVFQYDGQMIRQSHKGALVSAIFGIYKVTEEEVDFLAGDVFHEYYFYDKWFNIYEIHAGDSPLIKAWYCNLCRPAEILPDRISYEDLALDLLIYPDGKQSILDREEFRVLHINAHERRMALEGLSELQNIFKSIESLNLKKLL